MLEVLITKEGKVNKPAIDYYKGSFGIDSPYFGFSEAYDQQTPLFAAVHSKEIDEEVKLELVSYLLLLGANINGLSTNDSGGLIAVALSQQNTRLASLLLKEGARIDYTYREKSLIDIAIESGNKDVTFWVLKNASTLFFDLNIHVFAKIINLWKKLFVDNREASDLLDSLEKAFIDKSHREIFLKFTKLGKIDKEVTALIVAAEMDKKNRNNTIFVIADSDIPILIQEIKKLLESPTLEGQIKFQIIHFPLTHAIFGEFIIDKTLPTPKVTYVHCDPLPPTTKYDDIITENFVKVISPLACIEILDSDVTIQKGLGCSYFSIDWALMSTTPQDRDYVPNLIQHMKQHIIEKIQPYADKNVTYIKSSSLPVRFIRGLQHFEDGTGSSSHIQGLNTLIFKSKDAHTIVNKKNESATKAIAQDLRRQVSPSNPNVIVRLNLRAERKMKTYGECVEKLLTKFSIIDPKTKEMVENCKITGLVAFCNSKIIKETAKAKP